MAVLKKNQVNQILFCMVDKTDFATIETSLASNFTVKRFGVNHGSAAANVSTLSRVVSKVGSGIYRLSLEANACNYDYVAIRIAHASAATQVLVYEMRTYDDTDTWSQLSDIGSDLKSYMAGLSATISDIDSALSSQYTKVYSRLSDIQSDFQSRVPKEVANASQLLLVKSLASDAHSAAAQANSRVLVTQSLVSDIDSALSSQYTKVYSRLSDIQSDFQSRVPKEVANASQLLLMKSNLSDIESALDSQYTKVYSRLSDIQSDFQSRVPKEVANASQLLLMKSQLSDAYSMLSDFQSDFQSRVPKAVATNSQVSDLASDLKSYLAGISDILSNVHGDIADMSNILSNTHADLASLSGVTSDIYSLLSSRVPKEIVSKSLMSDYHSDLKSAVGAIVVTIGASDVSDIASAVIAGMTTLTPSDISDIASAVWAYGTRKITSLADVSLCASDLSDIRSAITAGGGALTDSNISDIASAVWAYGTKEVSLGASDLSDIRSAVLSLSAMLSDTHSAAAQANSRALVVQSMVSDVDSALTSQFNRMSDYLSDLLSVVTVTGVQLNASSLSDIRSVVLSLSDAISNAYSAAVVGASRALVVQSLVSDVDSALTSQFTKSQSDMSDIYSLLSDLNSNIMSRVPKEVASKSLLSDVNSNLLSYLAGMSDTISNIHGDIADLSNVLSNTHADLENLSGVASNVYSLLSDLDSNIMSRVPKEVANASQLLLVKSSLSDIESAIDSQAVLSASSLSDILSGVTRTRKIVQNRMKITSATGAAKLYDDDDITVLLSDTITADATSTVRTRLA